MMKRRLGSALSGRSYWSRRRDLMLMVLTHNIMILLPFELVQQIRVFYRACQNYFLVCTCASFRGRPRGRIVRSIFSRRQRLSAHERSP